MFIYIDESGSFAYPKVPQHSYACAGALTVPERRHGAVLKGFKTLKRKWGLLSQEVKGSSLDEGQISQIIRLLASNDVKFHVCVVDLLHHPSKTLAFYKDDQARRLLANVTDKHHPDLIKQLEDIGVKLRNMPDQLFLQLLLMIELVNVQLHDIMFYFAQKDPPELSRFRWVADRKGIKKTTFEDLWQMLLPPFIQSRQFSNDFDYKIGTLKGGNYEYCSRFFKTIERWPDHLPEQSPGLRSKNNIDTMDISLVIKESFTLADSAEKQGLQLADIVTNALRRSISGNLQEQGWSDLGLLMFRWKNKTVRLVHFACGSEESPAIEDELLVKVTKAITHKAGHVLQC